MSSPNDIAIIGMACHFPGARNPSEYWRNLRDGIESVASLTDDELLAAGVDRDLLEDRDYVKAEAILADMDKFDADFFGLSPRDAAIMDPQHRHFFECSWEALENAGRMPETFDGAIGVYAGCGMGSYLMFNLLRNRKVLRDVGLFLLRHTGNDKDFLATRLSYELNLTGPSVSVQTACSTSLTAIHMACQSLLSGECDMALAGGVTIGIPHGRGYLYQEGEIMSKDGHCRPFDADSTGTIFGSGAGVVVLRRAADAIADGDNIRAIIRGSAINNDGSTKAGYLAPSVDGQAAAIAEAIQVADVAPESISFIETHGTGTAIGDVIEFQALSQAFEGVTSRQACALGSAKSNIGHLDTAAGVAGLMKTVLALEHEQIPPTLHYKSPNPQIPFASSPFYLNDKLSDWKRSGEQPRRAGVTSLGVGGTNAHVILEEAQRAATTAPSRPWRVLTVSARTETALETATDHLADFLPTVGDAIGDAEMTLQAGRRAFEWRRFALCQGAADARTVLSRRERTPAVKAGAAEPSVAFSFPGGGAQHVHMGADLYRHEPVYRDAVDQAARIVRARFGIEFLPWVYPAPGAEKEAAEKLEQPSIALPALLACEYAMAQLWKSWGVEPDAMIGHSMGEYTAACLAGVMSLEDALALVTVRGRLFEKLAPGSMTSVAIPEAELRPLLPEGLSIAAVNAPELCVASGEAAAIAALERTLVERGIEHRPIRIAVAAHSAMVEPILGEFRDFVSSIRLSEPTIPYVSNVTGDWVTPEQAQSPEYWVQHLRSTVRFAAGVQKLLDAEGRLVLEVGPGQTLTSLARLAREDSADRALASLPRPKHDESARHSALAALGRLWQAGKTIDWEAFHAPDPRQRISLPTYPFERKRYWIDADPEVAPGIAADAQPAAADPLASLFHRPIWQRSSAPYAAEAEGEWLVFADPAGPSGRLADSIASSIPSLTYVEAGERFAQLSPNRFTVQPGSADDHLKLVQALKQRGSFPSRIAHLWSVTADDESPQRMLELGFYSLLFLAQALSAEAVDEELSLSVVSNHMQRVRDEALLHSEKATLLGVCRVIPQELQNVRCRSLDLSELEDVSAAALLAELSGSDDAAETTIAYRNGARWVQTVETSPLPAAEDGKAALRQQGVYLITGGFGGLGLALAERLSKQFRARIALVGRSGMPPRGEWPVAMARKDVTSARVRKLLEIEALGGEVLTLKADVSDASQMRAAIDETRQRFGPIHGIFHTAGVLDDGLIALKTRESAENVLRPKVRGALVLEALAEECGAEFVVYYSSISAHLGLAGQSDYAAANAFLNAHAQAHGKSNGLRVVAVNWPAWRDAGMASAARDASDGVETGHMLLGRRREESPDRIVFTARYDPSSAWFLDEHRVDGLPVLPGTAYVEIARAALAQQAPGGVCELEDLYLLAPMVFDGDEALRVRVTLERASSAWNVSVASETAHGWTENARAKVRRVEAARPATLDLAQVRAACAGREQICGPDYRSGQEVRLAFGPHWRCLERTLEGAAQACAEIKLAPGFAPDLDDVAIHPAMLDQATGFAIPLIEGYRPNVDFFVPMAYQKARIYGPFTGEIVSHARYLGAEQESYAFDITITTKTGEPLMEIERFTMRKIAADAALKNEAAGHESTAAEPAQPSLLDELLACGVDSNLGLDALERILAHDSPSEIIVSPFPLDELSKRLVEGRKHAHGARHGSRTIVEPRNPVEQYLAEVWSAALGLDKVGVEDNWFEMGGHSLLGIRILGQVQKKYAIQLSLDFFFGSPTISVQAEKVQQKLAEGKPAESIGLAPVGRERFRMKREDLR